MQRIGLAVVLCTAAGCSLDVAIRVETTATEICAWRESVPLNVGGDRFRVPEMAESAALHWGDDGRLGVVAGDAIEVVRGTRAGPVDVFVNDERVARLESPAGVRVRWRQQSRRPLLAFGVRGVTSMELSVYGASRPLHSGHYGNWAPNPGLMLAQLLASMKDADGRVVIDGFHDSITPLGERERAALASLPDFDGELMRELGLARTEGGGASLAERLQLPSLNVRGLASANVGDGARNVIPSSATAALDVRLVKGNDPAAMLALVEEHVRRQGYHVVRDEPDLETRLAHPRIARIVRGTGYRAVRTPMDHPIVPGLIAAAEAAAGAEVVLLPSFGGSLPLYLFEDVLRAPIVIVPIANHDDNQHAADENLRLANLWYGVDLFCGILTMPARAR